MEENKIEKKIFEKISQKKEELGNELVILAHHYQRSSIVDFGDYKGDSFELSRRAAENNDAKYIVFCGVHFMAESACILSQPHQVVQIPDIDAGCWMADMADTYLLEKAWGELAGIVDEHAVIPVVYMNADAGIKSFCGSRGGLVCTSSNAPAAFEWAFKRGEKIFFFPDEHLGRNSGNRLGIPTEEMIVWDREKPLGGNTPEAIKNAKIILWNGYCLVHTRFTVEQIKDMRIQYPDASIIVHPECTEEVVNAADANGSTSFIVKYVEEAPEGSTIIVGTEVNLVKRLDDIHGDKTVIPLKSSLCPNMYKINPENLLHTLENIGQINVVTVPDDIKRGALIALNNMLELAK